MANNSTSRDNETLFLDALDAKVGALQHGATIPLKQNDAEAIGADLDAALAAQMGFRTADKAFREAITQIGINNEAMASFLTSYKSTLVVVLGTSWTPVFATAGFP